MAITYPLTFPTSVVIERINWQSKSLVSVSQSEFTGAQEVQVHGGGAGWWEGVVSIAPLNTIAESDEWVSFLISLNGREGTFLMGDPLKTAPRGTALGTPLVNGASQTGVSLITDGWTASQTGVLLAGDLIQVGTGSLSRLHMVKEDADADGSGNSTIEIFPNLRESPSDGSAITISSPVGKFRLSSDTSSWDITHPNITNLSFAILEAF